MSSTTTTTTTLAVATTTTSTTVVVADPPTIVPGSVLALDVLALVPSSTSTRTATTGTGSATPADREGTATTRVTKCCSKTRSDPVQVDPSGCQVIAGDRYSSYDGVTHTHPAEVQIDHVVALKLTVITVAGGLASTVSAPLGAWLVDTLGWRQALAVLGVGGGLFTALLHTLVLPAPTPTPPDTQVSHQPAPPFDRRLRRLRDAVILEQAAMIATAAYLIALLVEEGVALPTASAALAAMGLGEVGGRLLVLGTIGRRSLTLLATIATVIQLAGLALPLGITAQLDPVPHHVRRRGSFGSHHRAAPPARRRPRRRRPVRRHQRPHPTHVDIRPRRCTTGARRRRHRLRLVDRLGCLPDRLRLRRRALPGARPITPRLSAHEQLHRADVDRSPSPGRRHPLLGAQSRTIRGLRLSRLGRAGCKAQSPGAASPFPLPYASGMSARGPSRGTWTVMFTDVADSTRLRVRIGDDRFDEFRREHDRIITATVERCGGRVVKFTGDGVMAIFASATNALDAAVGCQAEVQRLRGRPPGKLLRVGLSIGDVAIDDSDVQGTPVVEAARLCAAAAAGQILCGALVRAIAGSRSRHETVDAGGLELKGLAAPVPACEVLWDASNVVAPLPAALDRVGPAVFVGRDEHLDRALDAWRAVVEAGSTRALLIAGEPGIGKSRFSRELALLVSPLATVLAGRAEPVAAAPFMPVIVALSGHVRGLDVQHRDELLAGLGELGRVFPDLIGGTAHADGAVQLAMPVSIGCGSSTSSPC